MRRAAWIAGSLALLAVLVRRAVPVRKAPEPPAALSSFPSKATKLDILRDILSSRNDNDPRLDTAFNTLSPEDKALFRQEYRSIPPERRNERGTIVYLLGKNPSSPDDWAFLRDVAGEAPCLSLADCSKKPAAPAGGEDLGDDVTLAYPSLVALTQTRRALEANPATPAVTEGAAGVIDAGLRSKSPAVAILAQRLQQKRGRIRP